MNEAINLFLKFAVFAIPKIPGLFPVIKDFWGANNLGPMPPDLEAWADVDRRIDAERDALKGGPK